MNKKLMATIATGLVLVMGTSAFAATTSDVQSLDAQVRDKVSALQSQTLTDAQQQSLKTALESQFEGYDRTASMTDAQKAEMETKRAEMDAQTAAFKATLSAEQLAAYEAMMPVKPEQDTAGNAAAVKVKLTDTERTAMEAKRAAFEATLTESQKADYQKLFSYDKTATMTDEQKAEMEAKRAERDAKMSAFKATLTEEQKATYESLMPTMPVEGQQMTKPTDAEREATKAKLEAFMNTLTAEQKTAFEKANERNYDNMTQEQLDERAAKLQNVLTALNGI